MCGRLNFGERERERLCMPWFTPLFLLSFHSEKCYHAISVAQSNPERIVMVQRGLLILLWMPTHGRPGKVNIGPLWDVDRRSWREPPQQQQKKSPFAPFKGTVFRRHVNLWAQAQNVLQQMILLQANCWTVNVDRYIQFMLPHAGIQPPNPDVSCALTTLWHSEQLVTCQMSWLHCCAQLQ